VPDQRIPLSKIDPNPRNPRSVFDPGDLSGLARSIAIGGIKVPLIVYMHPRDPGRYVLIDGERRWRAAADAGLGTVPCEVHPTPRHFGETVTEMLIIGWQREDWNPIDKAKALRAAIDNTPGMNQRRLATRIGVAESVVSYHLSLLDLAPETQEAVIAGDIPAGRAHRAVRESRRQQRAGTRPKGRKTQLEPAWFSPRHELYEAARALCVGNHPARPRVGYRTGVCGQCWQHVIEDAHEQDLARQGRLLPAGEGLTLAQATRPTFRPPA
jgi:ParB/RepB/Spo0J family partition protein